VMDGQSAPPGWEVREPAPHADAANARNSNARSRDRTLKESIDRGTSRGKGDCLKAGAEEFPCRRFETSHGYRSH